MKNIRIPQNIRDGVKLSALALVAGSAFILTGCGPQIWWQERHTPTTDAERKAVAEQEEKILAATPTTLAGHDQDWDDAIKAAHDAACKTQCRVTLWEMADYNATGKWRYADANK